MTGSGNQDKPKADIEAVLVEFDAREDMLAAFCARTKSLIEASLQDANIQYQSVQVRVKSRKKVEAKYLDPKKNYTRLSDITDLAGLRVITYYEDDVDRAAEVIKREFLIDPKNSIDKRHAEPDRFGYNALNYVCKHLEKRTIDVEYKKFAGVNCEIQITSILRHAWAEIEHEWYDLKDSYPDKVKRRFYRTAALLELAESEFLDIRKSRTQYERSVAVRVEAKVPDLPVDAVSLKSFIKQEALVGEIDKSIASVLGTSVREDLLDSTVETWARAANLAGITKIQDVRDSLKKRLMVRLTPLDATLTKNTGVGSEAAAFLSSSTTIPPLSFHTLTNCNSSNSFVLKFIQNDGGVVVGACRSLTKATVAPLVAFNFRSKIPALSGLSTDSFATGHGLRNTGHSS